MPNQREARSNSVGLTRKLAVVGIIVLTLGAAAWSALDAARLYWRREALLSYDVGHVPRGIPDWFAHDPQVLLTSQMRALHASTFRNEEVGTITANARALLREEPLNPDAVYALGIAADNAVVGSGLPYFQMAERLSRREVYNEMALESTSIQEGDLNSALVRIDRVVTVVPGMAPPLFQSIAPALTSGEVQAAFLRYVHRPWFIDLIQAVVQSGGDVGTVLSLTAKAGTSIDSARRDGIYADLIRRSIALGDYVGAREVVLAMPARDRLALSNFAFSPLSVEPRLAPLGWAILPDTDVESVVHAEGTLAVTIAPEKVRIVASRETLLEPGRYVFQQTIHYEGQAPRAGVVWDVVCETSRDVPFWHQPVPVRADATATYQSVVEVPANCGAQEWRLQVVGDFGQNPSTVSIGGLKLGVQ